MRNKTLIKIIMCTYILFTFLSIHTVNSVFFYIISFIFAIFCLIKKYLKLSITFIVFPYLTMPIWLLFNSLFYKYVHHYSILADLITVIILSLLLLIINSNKDNISKDKLIYLSLSLIVILFYQYAAYSDIIYWCSIFVIITSVSKSIDIEFIKNNNKKAFFSIFILFLLLFVYSTYSYFEIKKSDNIAILKSDWCDVSKNPNKNNYLMDYFYAYSDFLTILKSYGEVQIVDNYDLEKDLFYNTIILITPTQPLTKYQVVNLDNFVRKGGRLILITDHTNLYGHLDAVRGLLTNFRVRMSDDAVFNPTNYYEKAILNVNNICFTSLYMKTGNSIIPPLNAKVWAITPKNITEKADYTNQNFFGDLTFSADDRIGNFPIGVTIKRGKGDFVIWNDSTIFSNFAISQKDNIKLLDYLIKNKIYKTTERKMPFKNINIISTEKDIFLESPPGHMPSKNHFSTLISNFTRQNLWPNFTNKQSENSILFTTYEYLFKNFDNIKSKKIIIINDIPDNNVLNIKQKKFERNNSDDFYYASDDVLLVCRHKGKQIIVAKNLFSDNELGTWWNNTDISPYKKYMITELLNWIQNNQTNIITFKYPETKNKKLFLKLHFDNGKEEFWYNVFVSDKLKINNENIIYLGHRRWAHIVDFKTILGTPEMSDNFLNNSNMKWVGTLSIE